MRADWEILIDASRESAQGSNLQIRVTDISPNIAKCPDVAIAKEFGTHLTSPL